MVKDHFAAFSGRLIASESHPRSLWRWGLCSAIYPPCDQACTRLLLNRRSCLASCSTAFPGAPGRSSVHQGLGLGRTGQWLSGLKIFWDGIFLPRHGVCLVGAEDRESGMWALLSQGILVEPSSLSGWQPSLSWAFRGHPYHHLHACKW